MSVISLSRLWSRMIVGANTTARFLGDIWADLLVSAYIVLDFSQPHHKAYQVLSLTAGDSGQMEHQELQSVAMLRWKHIHRLL
jgi:hypothetical protein